MVFMHGNVDQAFTLVEDCYLLCNDPGIGHEKPKILGKHLAETDTYICNNAKLIPNYGEKYRYGETITTSFAESNVNEVVARRMVKKQQMQ
jgi:hypothetical protein